MGCNEMKEKKRVPPNQNTNTNPTTESLNKETPQENENVLKQEQIDNNAIDNQNPQTINPLPDPYNNTPMIDQNLGTEEQEIKKIESYNIDQANLRNNQKSLNLHDSNSSDLSNSNNNEDNKENNLLMIEKEEYIPDYIGKLCYEPLLLFVYECKKNTFQVKKFEQSVLDFDTLNSSCSYCNGDNKLFVSGGLDNNENILDKLWIFDLIDYNVDNSIQISPKKNHSMIYIPKNYIFFVGGNDEKVFYLNINEKKIENWENLNKKRTEPALIQVNDFLYVFDNINKDEDNNQFELTFEKTNLLTSKPKWELIKPRLSGEILQTNIIPKFFGVSKESDNSIIFLGGILLDELDNRDEAKYYKYSIKDNIIEFSNIPFVNVRLNEKCFLSFNNKNNIYFILPDFHKKCPQVVFYIKNKNSLKIIDYMPNAKNEEKRIIQNNNQRLNRENNNIFKKYDFNMPRSSEKINEIIEI
jgi:hypothetical protein